MIFTKNGSYIRKGVSSGNRAGVETLRAMRSFQKNYGVELIKPKGASGSDIQRLERNMRRTRSNILKVLRSNLDDESYFLTLTFAENLQDYKKANQLFHYWARVKNKGLKYLLIKELQQRGAIHYHMILFDCPGALDVAKSWFHGRVNLKHIENKYAWSIANYLTKYFDSEKNQLVHNNKKVFSTSTNLLKPIPVDFMFLKYMQDNYYNGDKSIAYTDYEIDKFLNAKTLACAFFGDDIVKVVEYNDDID